MLAPSSSDRAADALVASSMTADVSGARPRLTGLSAHAPAERDRLGDLLAEPTTRRVLLLAVFLAGLVVSRSLLVCLLAAVATYELLMLIARGLRRAWPTLAPAHARTLGVSLTVAALVLMGWGSGALILDGAQAALTHVPRILTMATASPLWRHVEAVIPPAASLAESVTQYARAHLTTGLAATAVVGRGLLMAIIGMIVAVIYLGEQDKVRALTATLPVTSPSATLMRWIGYVGEGFGVMIRTQVLVAAANALLTVPVLVLMGLPELPTLTLLVFLGSLVPVVGNLAMGVVLALVAASVSGMSGAVLITVLTTALHKIESYWINPRFASAHVRLPTVIIIASLLVWEHTLGLMGFFVSLPALVVLQRLRQEFVTPTTDMAGGDTLGPDGHAGGV